SSFLDSRRQTWRRCSRRSSRSRRKRLNRNDAFGPSIRAAIGEEPYRKHGSPSGTALSHGRSSRVSCPPSCGPERLCGTPADHTEAGMLFNRSCIGAIVTAAALTMTIAGAAAFDESKYPDWSGQWQRPRGPAFPNVGNQRDPTKPPGLGQQAPLTPEYQARLVASLADQAQGGQGLDNLYKCITNGMPRVMSFTFPVEFVILPTITYVNFEIFMPRRIYTDGRDFPKD